MVHSVAASAARFLGLSLRDRNKVGFLPIESMTMVNGTYGVPSCFLPHQIHCWLLMECVGARREPPKAASGGKGRNRSFNRMERSSFSTMDELLYLLMSSIVVRTTNCPELLFWFARHMHSQKQIELPLCQKKFDMFVEFLEEGVEANTGMALFTRVLQSKCNVGACTGTVQEYACFLKGCRDDLKVWLDDSVGIDRFIGFGLRCGESVEKMLGVLVEHGFVHGKEIDGAMMKKLKFMASGIVCEMNEVMVDAVVVSEKSDELAVGPYCEQGLSLLSFDCMGNGDSVGERLKKVTRKIVSFLMELDEDVLEALALEKDKDGHGLPCIVLDMNGRMIWELDSENILCKIVVVAQRKGGSHAGSITIQMHRRPYEWPNTTCNVEGSALWEVARNVLSAYLKSGKKLRNWAAASSLSAERTKWVGITGMRESNGRRRVSVCWKNAKITQCCRSLKKWG